MPTVGNFGGQLAQFDMGYPPLLAGGGGGSGDGRRLRRKMDTPTEFEVIKKTDMSKIY